MKKILSALLIVGYTLPFNAQTTVTEQIMLQSLEEKIISLLNEEKIPGLAIAVIHHGELIHKEGYGYADLTNKIKISPDTGFNIGSISKMFTAFGVMKLIEEGVLVLDTPVSQYLTRWQLPESKYNENKVNIRALLNHTGGISVHGYPGFTDKEELPSLEASLNGFNGPVRADEKVEIVMAPQTKFNYSGGGYTILQLVIEEVTGISFEQFMEQQVFQKLKMENTSFTINKRILQNSALPYDANLKPLPFEYFTAKAAAGLQTTLNDFILFAEEIYANHKIITDKNIRLMLKPTEVSDQNYGLGFRVLHLGPIELKGHSGSNTGWQSGFFMDFNNNSGLIMMSNGDQGDIVLKKLLKHWASIYYKL